MDSENSGSEKSSDSGESSFLKENLQEESEKIQNTPVTLCPKVRSLKNNDHSHTAIRLDNTRSLEADAMVVRIFCDHTICVIGLSNGDIRLFRLSKGMLEETSTRLKDSAECLPCTDVQYFHGPRPAVGDEKQCILASYASGCVRMWSYTTASKRNSLLNVWKERWFKANDLEPKKNDSTNQILCISISFDNKRFITGGTDAYIRVYEIASHKPGRILQPSITAYNTPGHTSRITALAYHPKGRSDVRYLPIFVSAGWDDSIQIWNDQQSSSLWRFYGPHVAGSDGLDIDPIRNTILTCSWRRDRVPIQLWQFPEFVVGLDKSIAEHQKESYKKPMPHFSNELLSQATQGYVVKCDSAYQFALFAGSNKNIISVVSLRHNAVSKKPIRVIKLT
ncbi:WD domain G-beta repeat protein [Paragonimus heterotremus]|uniref:WD domain G-beta repeat protein n=1 Tax=Paragonimus heterotremus TaxID=100268 RepID=A0A8J4WEE8_9TREM|nr:WD domain G-beta repeat protein [Paragonimus heterotremus]